MGAGMGDREVGRAGGNEQRRGTHGGVCKPVQGRKAQGRAAVGRGRVREIW